jgi:hypothetical protein
MRWCECRDSLDLTTPMDEHEAQTLADIDRFGWSLLKVSNDMGPDFVYSVGMFRTLGHPEIVMFGLRLNDMCVIINDVGAHVRAGARYTAGQVSDEFLQGYDVTFRAVPEYQYAGHLGWANWLYGGHDYPALQLIFPDREHRWPWDDAATASFRETQPVLADIAVPLWAKK